MRHSKVLPFPSGKTDGNGFKVFALAFYLTLAYILIFGVSVPDFSLGAIRLSEGGLSVLLILGLMYTFLLRKQIYKSSYFSKNKVLLLILLVIFTLAFQLQALVFMLLAGLYWLLIGHSGKEAPYFLRFHLATALILNFFLLMPYLILQSAVALLIALFKVLQLGAFALPLVLTDQIFLPLLTAGFMGLAAIWLSISALMGRTPYIKIVTQQVRSLA